jgi:hypothetical protein
MLYRTLLAVCPFARNRLELWFNKASDKIYSRFRRASQPPVLGRREGSTDREEATSGLARAIVSQILDMERMEPAPLYYGRWRARRVKLADYY